MAEQSTGEGRAASPPSSSGPPTEADELSDRALDAVVGGLSVDAALSRAAAFDSDLLR